MRSGQDLTCLLRQTFLYPKKPTWKDITVRSVFLKGLAVLRCLLWWQAVVRGACWPQTEHPTLNPLCKVFVPSPTSVWKVAVLAYSVVHWWRCYPRHLVLRRSERILVGYSRDPIKPRNVCAKNRLLLTKATLSRSEEGSLLKLQDWILH